MCIIFKYAECASKAYKIHYQVIGSFSKLWRNVIVSRIPRFLLYKTETMLSRPAPDGFKHKQLLRGNKLEAVYLGETCLYLLRADVAAT